MLGTLALSVMAHWADTHIEGAHAWPCTVCGRPTRFIEVNFEVVAHPGACSQEWWRRYAKAERAAVKREVRSWRRMVAAWRRRLRKESF